MKRLSVRLLGAAFAVVLVVPHAASAKPAVLNAPLPSKGVVIKGERVHRNTVFPKLTAAQRKSYGAAIHKRLLPKINSNGKGQRTIKKIIYLGTSRYSQTYVETPKRPTGATADARFNVEDSQGVVHTVRLRSRRIAGSGHWGENVALYTSGARGVISQTNAQKIAASSLKLKGALSPKGLTANGRSYVFQGQGKSVLVDIWSGKSRLK